MRSSGSKSSDLTLVPGVGLSIARDLEKIGIRCIDDLKGKNPEKLYAASNKVAGVRQDPCLLYVFRCAVYFSGLDPEKRNQFAKGSKKKTGLRDPKLNWWWWKDRVN